MNITRRFLLWGAAAVAAATSLKPVAAAMPPAPPPVPSWVPEGWLPCWGQSVSRKEYPRLFALIGDTYGETDGETFALPGHGPEPEHTRTGAEFETVAVFEQLIATGDGKWGPTGVIVDYARQVRQDFSPL